MPDRVSYPFEVLKDLARDHLLVDGPEEAFGLAIGLGLLDKGEAGVNAPVFELVVNMI